MTGAARIVVVDDEPDLRLLLEDYLGTPGLVVRTARPVRQLDRLLAHRARGPAHSRRQHAGRGRLRRRRAPAAGRQRGRHRHADRRGHGRRTGWRASARRCRRLPAQAVRAARAAGPRPQRAAAGRPAACRPRASSRTVGFGRFGLDLDARRLLDAPASRDRAHRHGVRPAGHVRPSPQPGALARSAERARAQPAARARRPQHRHPHHPPAQASSRSTRPGRRSSGPSAAKAICSTRPQAAAKRQLASAIGLFPCRRRWHMVQPWYDEIRSQATLSPPREPAASKLRRDKGMAPTC